MAAKKKGKKTVKKAKKTARPARKKAAAKSARRAVKARKQPESLRLRSASPSLTVNDIQRSLRFYRDTLGFTVKDRVEREGRLAGVELLAGKVTFWLSQDDWGKGRDRVKGQGLRLYCQTSQNVDALARQVKNRGGGLAEEPKDQPWGGRDFAVVDPDGFKISFSSSF
jgi:uncharacterized glyoxalase superfamily protein PhnB